MGRIMSFDQDGRRVRDFDKSEHDFLRRYGRTPDEVLDENAKLRELASVMAYCMQYERDCDGCAMNGASGAVTEHVGCDGLRDALRKLGVVK